MVTRAQRRAVEWGAALVFGVVMTLIERQAEGPILGGVSGLAIFLGMILSGSMGENPVLLATVVAFWAVLGWLVYRVARLFIVDIRRS